MIASRMFTKDNSGLGLDNFIFYCFYEYNFFSIFVTTIITTILLPFYLPQLSRYFFIFATIIIIFFSPQSHHGRGRGCSCPCPPWAGSGCPASQTRPLMPCRRAPMPRFSHPRFLGSFELSIRRRGLPVVNCEDKILRRQNF